MKIVHALIAFVGLLAACASVEGVSNPAPSGSVTITLTRGVCFGFCPDYTVSITQDGVVRYEGRRFVAVTGVQTAQISPAEVQHLLERFEAVNFTELRNEYRAQVSDLPTYTVSLRRGGVTKQVVDYGGLHAGMPESVRALQDEIDRVAGTARWVLRDGQPVRGERR